MNEMKKMRWMKNKLQFGLRYINWKIKDLIKLWIGLINQIKSLIVELINLRI
jgi:hypothetical protein